MHNTINEYWGVVSQIGLWCWIFFVILTIYKTFPAKDEFIRKSALKYGSFSLFFFLLWILGMKMA